MDNARPTEEEERLADAITLLLAANRGSLRNDSQHYFKINARGIVLEAIMRFNREEPKMQIQGSFDET